MRIGTHVQNTVVIQSDDQENGLMDGTPTIPIGTNGVIIGMSKDVLEDEHFLKPGCEDCVVVSFDLPSGDKWNFDVSPSELCIV